VRNLGPTINTEYDEDGPFIDIQGTHLYFSSRGHKGMGGHDIFRTELDATNEWSEPVNLGYPINTPDDDIYFISSVDGTRAYYSSVREDGMGYTDIYVITVPEGLENIESTPVATVIPPIDTPVETPTDSTNTNVVTPKATVPLKYVVTVVDAETKAPREAKVGLQGQRDNVIVGMRNEATGVYVFNITSSTPKDYRLSVDKDGYVFYNQNLKIEGAGTEGKTLTRTVEMRKVAVGVSGVLRNIYFDFDKWSFKTESYTELNKLERMMSQNRNINVEISGHTDNIGTTAYNKFLSRKRAEAVKDFLTKKGIDARRVKAVGYGEGRPLASNDDEKDGREVNRRVEFLVIQ
jgi:outer membrane protein OmpA-like peptidoglycan-associated protein